MPRIPSSDLVHQFLEAHAEVAPERPLCLQGDRQADYGEVEALANRFARALVSVGVQRGDRVAMWVDNSIGYVAAYYGVLKAGATSVEIYSTATEGTVEYILKDCTASVLITQAKRLAAVERMEGIRAILLTDDADDSTDGSTLLPLAAVKELPAGRCQRDVAETDLASIVYTSGSTGEPRGAMLSHRNLVANTRSIVEYLGLTADDRVMVVLPLPYVYGKSLLNTHVAAGGSLSIGDNFVFPAITLETMRRHETTGFSGIPSTFAILLERSPVRRKEFPALRYLTQAGGAMTPALIREVMEVFPGKDLYIMYGATEAGARLSYLPPEELPRKIGSIGKAIPDVRLRVINEEGIEVEPGETGEIVAQGPNIMQGYWNQPEETAAVLNEHGFHTGDLATIDDEGFLYVVGRKRDMIKPGGNRVSAKEIEETLLEHPAVIEAAVIGVPDPQLGEAIRAYVVLRKGSLGGEPADPQTVISFCRDRLPEFKVPRVVSFLTELPKNESGKIMKEKLRTDAAHCGSR